MADAGEHEVEEVFGWVMQNGQSYYWVKWQGYSLAQAT